MGFHCIQLGATILRNCFFKIGGMNCLIWLTRLKIYNIEYVENGLKFNKKYKKENNWAKLHPLGDGEAPCDLGEYSDIGTHTEVVLALQEGLKMAQIMLRHLNMAPSVHARASLKIWFTKPWEVVKSNERFMVLSWCLGRIVTSILTVPDWSLDIMLLILWLFIKRGWN